MSILIKNRGLKIRHFWPIFAKKWALGEKVVCELYDSDWTFSFNITILSPMEVSQMTLRPSRHPTDTIQAPHRHPK